MIFSKWMHGIFFCMCSCLCNFVDSNILAGACDVFQLCSSCRNKSVGEHFAVSAKKRCCLMYLNGPCSWKLTCAYLNAVYFWHAYGVENLCTCVLGCTCVLLACPCTSELVYLCLDVYLCNRMYLYINLVFIWRCT